MASSKLITLLFFSALATMGLRSLPLTFLGRYKFRPLFEASLRYVPISILSAMLASQVLIKEGEFLNPEKNLILWTAALTLVVARVSKNLLVTVGFGVTMAAFLRHF